MKRLLILGGTGDAIKIAAKTKEVLNLKTIYSVETLTRGLTELLRANPNSQYESKS